MYIVKIGLDGHVDRLKARLVAKRYTRVYGSNYYDNFSPVAKIVSVHLLLSNELKGVRDARLKARLKVKRPQNAPSLNKRRFYLK